LCVARLPETQPPRPPTGPPRDRRINNTRRPPSPETETGDDPELEKEFAANFGVIDNTEHGTFLQIIEERFSVPTPNANQRLQVTIHPIKPSRKASVAGCVSMSRRVLKYLSFILADTFPAFDKRI
jgi:hypothetical protein